MRSRTAFISLEDIARVIACHGRWVVLTFPSNPSGHFQERIISHDICSLRSRDLGCLQCLLRLYVIGVPCDLVGYAAFLSLICFLGNFPKKVHQYDGASDVMRHLEKVGYTQPVELSPVVEDPRCIDQNSHVS